MPKICPECKGLRKVLADFPCRICKGAGFVVQNKLPAPCPATCDKGVVKGLERCPTCKGLGWVP